MATAVFAVVVGLVAGSADRTLVSVGIPYTSQVDFLRAAAFVVPVVVFAATFHVCRRLVAGELHPLCGRTGDRVVRRTDDGGFVELDATAAGAARDE